MKRVALSLMFLMSLAFPAVAQPQCTFTGSTAINPGGGPSWQPREDYPTDKPGDPLPWASIKFDEDWKGYMAAVLGAIKISVTIDPVLKQVSLKPDARWWNSAWMDYGSSGREFLNGLTKERNPDPGDLANNSPDTYQVWAVGYYNAQGAYTLGKVWANRCDPNFAAAASFEEGTAAFKFLFTDADPGIVKYLDGAPVVKAMIDPLPTRSPQDPTKRVEREVRLLQVDIAVKDKRAIGTGWVFGTFAWIGPRKGDGLWDNMVPVGLQWGNDPGVTDRNIQQGVVNKELEGVLYGSGRTRPFMGFNGRVNGPADNPLSSCLSCHALARAPRSVLGLVGRLPPPEDPTYGARVAELVKNYFQNVPAGDLMSKPGDPADAQNAIPLDYSLQVEQGVVRLCTACRQGRLQGPTPAVCKQYVSSRIKVEEPSCPTPQHGDMHAFSATVAPPGSAALMNLPRQ